MNTRGQIVTRAWAGTKWGYQATLIQHDVDWLSTIPREVLEAAAK